MSSSVPGPLITNFVRFNIYYLFPYYLDITGPHLLSSKRDPLGIQVRTLLCVLRQAGGQVRGVQQPEQDPPGQHPEVQSHGLAGEDKQGCC